MDNRPKTGFFDSPRRTATIRKYFYFFLVALLAVDVLFVPKHGHFSWEDAPFFFAAYGFIGCVALIFIAKGLRFLVRRKRDYYD